MKNTEREIPKLSIEEAQLMTPQELLEKSQKGELVVGCDFTEAEQAKVDKLANQIDIHDRLGLISYGSEAQNKLIKLSDERLSKYDTTQLGETGKALVQVVTDLKTYDPSIENQSNVLVRLFMRKKQQLEQAAVAAKTSFSNICKNIDEVDKILENEHYIPLTTEVKSFREISVLLGTTYRELSMYIAAGQKSLNHAKEVELPELDRKAQETKSNLDVQMLQNAAKDINDFEAGLFRLETSREQCMFQMAFVRKLEDIYLETARQIQDLRINTIPAWKTQMRLNLGMQDALNAQHSLEVIRQFANEVHLRSAEQLRELNAKTAQNMNKPVINIETSVKVNDIVKDMLNDDISILNQNMQEIHEGRQILRQIDESRNEALRNYARNIAQVAVQHAYTSSDPYRNSTNPRDSYDSEKETEIYVVTGQAEETIPDRNAELDGMHEATGDEPKKYTLS